MPQPMIYLTQQKAGEKLVSYPKNRKASRGLLKNILAAAFCACLFGIVSLSPGACQTLGYGDKPDQWAPYDSGQYFEHLQKIATTYRYPDSKITYLHFEDTYSGIGPIELFRIPVRPNSDCTENNCYFFVLFASNLGDAPLTAFCQFKRAALAHFFSPDGTKFWGFEFECQDTLLQVKVTPTHFMAISVKKTP
jgi:hypothetical protein